MNTTRSVLQSPGRIILGSFLLLIFLGTLLLSLPYAQTQTLSFLDVFFTATSATCVTGLTTIPLSSFTFFGHTILLLLMQIGGLGLITMLLAFTSLFGELGMAAHFFIGKLFDNESWTHIKKILVFILMLTGVTEIIGAFIIFCTIYKDCSTIPFGIFLSFFHSISMFCSAGMVVAPQPIAHLLTHNYTIMLTSIALMLTGSLGFFTLRDISYYYYNLSKGKHARIALDSKIILYGTLIIVTSGILLIYILENMPHASSSAALAGQASPSPHSSILSLFYTVVAGRGTGLLAQPLSTYTTPTICLILLLAFISGAPAGTGSGIKITTCAVFLATIRAAISGRFVVEIKGRSMIIEQVYKAIAIVSISCAWIFATTFCLLITDPTIPFFNMFIEAVSALTTLGVSTGITAILSPAGKILLITSMIVGRIGSLTLILGMKEPRVQRSDFSYPEERVMLG